MKKPDIRFVSIGGMLTALTVLFQATPVILPTLGLAVSPLSTLPVAIAAYFNPFLGVSIFLSSALLLLLISVQEALILLFSTGLLGITIGARFYKKGIRISTLFSGISLSFGMIFLTYIAGIPAFNELAGSFSTTVTFFIFFLFSIAYSALWNIGFQKFVNYLRKNNLFH